MNESFNEPSIHQDVLRFLGEWCRADPRGSSAGGFDDSLAEIRFRYNLENGRSRRMSLKAIIREDGRAGIQVSIFDTDSDYTPPPIGA